MSLQRTVCANRPSLKIAMDQSVLEGRLQNLELHHAELGARLAGLEGTVFALHRQLLDCESRLLALMKAPPVSADSSVAPVA